MAPKLAKLAGSGASPLGPLAAQAAARRGLGPGGMSPVETDGRRQEYNQLADDAAAAGPKREGAMLFSAAEKKLEEEDYEAAVKAAEDAVKLFRGMGATGKTELADALRLLITAHRVEDDAVKVATEEMAKFKDAGDKRGEGSMLLSFAEIYCDKSGKGKRDKYPEAMDKIKEALTLFKDAGDKKMEAIALNAKAFLHFRLFELDDAGEAVAAAMALCEELGDKSTKARCLRGESVHAMLVGKHSVGIEKAKDAIALYKELGLKKWEGAFGLSLVKWHMIAEDSKKALTVAESAYETFQGLGIGKGWEGLALLAVADVSIEQKKAKDALKTAKDALTKFTDAGDKKGVAFAQDALTRIHLAMDAPEKAIKSLEDAKAAVDELGDKAWAASLQHDFAAVHMASKSDDEAIEALGQAVELAEEAEDEEEGAVANRALASLQILRANGDYKDALKAANNARDLSQQCGDKYGEAIDTLGVCIAQGMLEENNKALTAANEAQELFQELKDPRGESGALEIIAELKMMDRKFDAAVEAAEERLTIATDLGDCMMEAAAKLQIAELQCEEGEYTEAEKFCRQAMELYQKENDARGEVFSMMTLIKIHSGVAGDDKADKAFKPNMEKAAKVANDAVGAAGKVGNKGLRAMSSYYKAMTLMFTDKLSDASKAASEAQSIYVGMGSDAGEARCLVLSAQLQLMNMNEDKALDMSDRALTVARKCGDAWAEYDAAAIVQQIQGRQQAMMAQYQMMMPADAQFAMAPQGGGGGGGEEAPASVAAKPKGLDPAFVRKQLMTFVKDVMATDDELELDSPFMEAGMDSLSSVSLMSMVAKEFQMALSPSLVFDFPTVRALEDHLVEESKNA